RPAVGILESDKLRLAKAPQAAPFRDDTVVLNQTEVDWKNTPPPVRASVETPAVVHNLAPPVPPPPSQSLVETDVPASPPTEVIQPVTPANAAHQATTLPNASVLNATVPNTSAPSSAPPSTAPLSSASASDSINVTVELAQQSPEALRGLGTLLAVID